MQNNITILDYLFDMFCFGFFFFGNGNKYIKGKEYSVTSKIIKEMVKTQTFRKIRTVLKSHHGHILQLKTEEQQPL